MNDLAPVFGVGAGLLSGSCAIPYVRDILRGTTKPHRVSWGIFALLASIAAASQLSEGLHSGAALSLGAAAAFVAIFLLSVRHGVGGASTVDRLTIVAAAWILAVWAATANAALAVGLVIILELTATALTMHKAWREPATETRSSWIIDGAAGALAVLGAQQRSFLTLAYPVYHLVSNNAVVLVLTLSVRRRRSLPAPPVDAPPVAVSVTRAMWGAPWRPPLRPPLPPPGR